jgi:hypothetical protein
MLIYPYNPGSRSAKALATALGIKRIKHVGSGFKPNKKKVVVNWGANKMPAWVEDVTIINHPTTVATVTNKLEFFRSCIFEDIIPWWTDDKAKAEKRMERGRKIVCRTILQGHGGAGIVIANRPNELVDAPLYVEYKAKKDEYRVHLSGKIGVFYVQKKARKLAIPDDQIDWQVRNHKNGFIFENQNVECPREVWTAVIDVFQASGLDFGAVDVVYQEQKDKAWVLEINTAPGLEGTSLERYVEMLQAY